MNSHRYGGEGAVIIPERLIPHLPAGAYVARRFTDPWTCQEFVEARGCGLPLRFEGAYAVRAMTVEQLHEYYIHAPLPPRPDHPLVD